MEIGQKVRKLRLSKKMTLAQASKKIGWSVANLSNFERGLQPDIRVSTLRKIAAALGVKPEDLL